MLRNLNYKLTKIIQIGKSKSIQKAERSRGDMINHPLVSERSACFCTVGMSCGSGLKYKANNFALYIASIHEGTQTAFM